MKKNVTLGLITSLIIFATNTSLLTASSISDIQRQQKQVQNKIDTLNKQKKTQEKKLVNAIEENKKIEEKQQIENKKYEQLNDQKKQCQSYIQDMNKQIEDAEKKYNDQIELLKKRLMIIYKNSDYHVVDVISDSKDIIDFFGKMEIISIISKRDKELLDSITELKKDIEYKKKQKQKESSILQNNLKDKQGLISRMQESSSRTQEEISNINAKLQYIEQQEDDLIEKSKELENSIKNLQTSGGDYVGGSTSWPVPSSRNITSPFGLRYHPILQKNKMHTGIDISASMGSSITSFNDGTVILAGWQGGYGYTVVVDHGGGITSLYGHCSKILVSVGQHVTLGTVIAKVGSTGMSTGPHLHFEIRNNGVPVNPLDYIK